MQQLYPNGSTNGDIIVTRWRWDGDEKTEAQSSYTAKVILEVAAELGTNTDPKVHVLPLKDKGGV